ncbi:hypothetical protein [Actinomadura miaoliensis]|uniref:PH domain-containing protein n=1 Tax=Actinomadura miaoliensis TaxID=430685 RepID=A0ABP7WER6_9ACTN
MVGDGPVLELRITQGRLAARTVMTCTAMAVVCIGLASLLAASELPRVVSSGGSLVLGCVAAGLLLAVLVALPTLFGGDPALTADGIRMKVFAWDRTQTVIPWSAIERLWIARTGQFDYLYVLPREPERYRRGRGLLRAGLMSQMHSAQGSALHIHLPADGISQERVRVAVEQFSGGAVRVTAAPSS